MKKEMIMCARLDDNGNVKYVPISDLRKERDEKNKDASKFQKLKTKVKDFWEDHHGEVLGFVGGAAAVGGSIFVYDKFFKKNNTAIVPHTITLGGDDDDMPFDEEDE